MPQISIIIPCYKQGGYLAECLRSLQAQTLSDWEAIVVDDASPDGQLIANIIEELGDPRIRLVRNQKNKGLAATRNIGVHLAHADLLGMLDADDQFMPTFCEIAVECFKRSSELNIVYGKFEIFGRWGSRVVSQMCPNDKLRIEGRYFLPGSGFVMRRRVWETIGGYSEDEQYRLGGEERDFWLRSIPKITGIAVIPQITYRYRQHADSTMANIGPHQYKIYRYIAAKNEAILKEAGIYSLFLAEGYKRGSVYFLHKHDKFQALRLAIKGLLCEPTNKHLVRIALLVFIPNTVLRLRRKIISLRSGAHLSSSTNR